MAGTESITTKKYHSAFADYPDVLNVHELSQILGGVSIKTCYRLLHSGKIEALKVGREYKIPKLKVLEYLKII